MPPPRTPVPSAFISQALELGMHHHTWFQLCCVLTQATSMPGEHSTTEFHPSPEPVPLHTRGATALFNTSLCCCFKTGSSCAAQAGLIAGITGQAFCCPTGRYLTKWLLHLKAPSSRDIYTIISYNASFCLL